MAHTIPGKFVRFRHIEVNIHPDGSGHIHLTPNHVLQRPAVSFELTETELRDLDHVLSDCMRYGDTDATDSPTGGHHATDTAPEEPAEVAPTPVGDSADQL